MRAAEKQNRISPYYRALKRNFAVIIITVSIAPLILVGGILDRFNSAAYRLKVEEHLKELVQKHAQDIDRYLIERLNDIRFMGRSFSYQQLSDRDFLRECLLALQQESGLSFVDVGVVNETGEQIAYAGPFQLGHASYADAQWFTEAFRRDSYISDVFLGLRGQPHFIVAVRLEDGPRRWVLRATVDFVAFNSMVENLRIGETGFAYILNKNGAFQTKPMTAISTEKAAYLKTLFQKESGAGQNVRIDVEQDASGQRRLFVSALIKEDQWLLIYQQKTSDAFSALSHTRKLAILVILLGGACIAFISLLLIRKIIDHLVHADREKELMTQQVIETGKLASIGELAAGVAHEINNPVAIMMEEAGWIKDLLAEEEFKAGKNLEEFERALSQIQTQGVRCKEITHKLLSFSRKQDAQPQDLKVNEVIEDVVGLSSQQARYNNIEIHCELSPGLPSVKGSRTGMQQVFMNLTNNAIDAMEKDGGTLTFSTARQNGHLVIEVADSGPGIPEAILDRVFDPFFTTKPVGKGTGLGLSICYGIIQQMGGEITAESQPGKGTLFRIKLPVQGP